MLFLSHSVTKITHDQTVLAGPLKGGATHAVLTRRERQIVDILYRRGRATAGEVMEELPGEPSYSTVRTQLRVLEEKGHVRHDPSTDEIQVAERGRGAWAVKDGARRRLRTSEESRTIVVEDGKSSGARRERAAQFTAAVIRADRWHFRSLGSTLALSYVSAGRVSAYVLFWASAVHTAAGTLLATEAGGTLSYIDGRPWTVDSDSVIVSATADLHQELLDLARSASKP